MVILLTALFFRIASPVLAEGTQDLGRPLCPPSFSQLAENHLKSPGEAQQANQLPVPGVSWGWFRSQKASASAAAGRAPCWGLSNPVGCLSCHGRQNPQAKAYDRPGGR